MMTKDRTHNHFSQWVIKLGFRGEKGNVFVFLVIIRFQNSKIIIVGNKNEYVLYQRHPVRLWYKTYSFLFPLIMRELKLG